MRKPELEQKIHDYIKALYKAEYKGRLEVTQEDDIYALTLGIPSYDIPTTISLQTDKEEEFLKYICEELRVRNFMRVYFYSIKRTDPKNDKISKRQRADR